MDLVAATDFWAGAAVAPAIKPGTNPRAPTRTRAAAPVRKCVVFNIMVSFIGPEGPRTCPEHDRAVDLVVPTPMKTLVGGSRDASRGPRGSRRRAHPGRGRPRWCIPAAS